MKRPLDAWENADAFPGPDRVDAALSASRWGVPAAEIRQAFGERSAEMAATASHWFGSPPPSAPDQRFVRRLELAVTAEHDLQARLQSGPRMVARPGAEPGPGVVAAWAANGASPLVAVAAAVAVAVGAFLATGGPATAPTCTPTAHASTETATAATALTARHEGPHGWATDEAPADPAIQNLQAAARPAPPVPLPEPTLDG
jgi:hypothetical protein